MRRNSDLHESESIEMQAVPVPSAISKIGTVDFLAVLPSGVLTFLVTYMVLSGCVFSTSDSTLWHRVQLMVADTLGNPLIVLSVLFVSYFFGIILRAFPAEWVVSNLHIGRRSCPRRRATDVQNGSGRRRSFRVRRGSTIKVRKPDVIHKTIIKKWKHALCHRSPEAYTYFQTVEARSRFAAAMLWAGVLGVTGSVGYIAVIGSSVAVSQLALVSILLTVIFGSLLPMVCRKEVAALLTLSETTRRSPRTYQGPGTIKPGARRYTRRRWGVRSASEPPSSGAALTTRDQ
jgi:hypothetical protein